MHEHLDIAARAAWRGAGRVEPNPMVGCVLVSPAGEVIAIGHHRWFGAMHAEREALAAAQAAGRSARGSTAYVTLEPCNGHAKQPPCTDALIEAGVARVVFAVRDPSPNKRGGAERLAAAGIAVEHRPHAASARCSAAWLKRQTVGLPWVIAKWAQTIDGRAATRTGESKWISGPAARRRVHVLRGRVDAVVTGLGTVLADDPMLTARGVPVRRTAARVIIDSDLETPADRALVRTAAATPTIIMCARELLTAGISSPARARLESAGVRLAGVTATPDGRLDLREALATLWREFAVATVMLECGPALLGSFFEADLVDESVVYVAPMLLGDELARGVAEGRVASSLSAGRMMRVSRVRLRGPDVEMWLSRG